MKRAGLIKWLRENGAEFVREGRRHTIYRKENRFTEVPRHREIVDILAKKICKDLQIPFRRG
ncbi:MAG: addiction module toxin, HicA family [Candidatus Lindowbacteria bacterium RIFCSPLOWO2_12_FULL_62_27]|nr:MAG: addiction module toxin, HicA family [Candidatus Lindowbacteria bacterium RIFCSPLOWO2_02_FULL_62_12]OGH62874.1 MAG: addiction module toxin, HicA family [Candidatus Lindowbacteria bacterium RIFCSPLOWO2_12_FULL_62_27]